MAQVLHHVIAWIDPEMITTIIQQSRGAQSKPLIRTYLRDALDNFARSNGMPDFQASEEQAIAMQKSILEFAREQAAEFLNCPIQPTFFTEPNAPDLTTIEYTTRFNTTVWTKLLHFMKDYLPNVTGSPTLTFRQEWDRMAVTLPTLWELPRHLSRIIANAKDPAAKAIVARALQGAVEEALATIIKPVRGQGASETAKPDSAAYATGTSLEAASESLPTIESLSRRDDELPATRKRPAVSASSCNKISSMPCQNQGASADETETHLDDPHSMESLREASLSPPLDDSHGMGSLRESSSLDPALWPDQPTKDWVNMPPKVSTASPTSKSLPQSKMSQDSAVRRGRWKKRFMEDVRAVRAEMLKTKNHRGGGSDGKRVASDQGTSFGPSPPTQGSKARFQSLPQSK
ncbi:hypothetical protein E4U39_007087 [Claviceps sp. Clav50 group G5]|nr:hypothetical protein E4U39_007087 [Claviceps sp. Clav50 group G5]